MPEPKAKDLFEVELRQGEGWKTVASFETEADALGYVRQLKGPKRSWRVLRDRYDPAVGRFKGRRVIHEKLIEEKDGGAGAAQRGRELDSLVEQRAQRLKAGTPGLPSQPEIPEEETKTLFERFVETRRMEKKKEGGAKD